MIVPTQNALVKEGSALALPRYASLVEYSECLFWGVYDDQSPGYACREYWSKVQRDTAAKYLAEAQDELEGVIHYPLERRWFGAGQCENDVQTWRPTGLYRARRGNIVAMGQKATADVALAEPVNHVADPAVIGPVATSVTEAEELRLFHPGLDVEIHPSARTLAAGQVTFEVPRCRLVKAEFADNDPTRPMSYNDAGVGGVFLQEVDIKRVYTDPTVHATVRYSDGLSMTVEVLIKSSTLGILCLADTLRQVWCGPSGSGTPVDISFNYFAGVNCLSFQQEDSILRLAHAKMPSAICSCEPWQNMWRRDRFVPEVLTRERLNCPFGTNDGAWTAWRFAQSFRLVRGGAM